METTFMFYDKPIAVINKDGEFYVSVRHVCDGIGFSDGKNQRKKVTDNPDVFNWGHITSVAGDGKQRDLLCIPLSRLNLWLCSISPSKVKPEIRADLIKYQCECADVLYSYFMRQEASPDINGIVAQISKDIGGVRDEVKLLRKELSGVKSALEFTFGNETPVIMSLIRDISELEGVDGREIWGDVQVALDVQSYKKMNRKIINYLKNRKDGSGLKIVQADGV